MFEPKFPPRDTRSAPAQRGGLGGRLKAMRDYLMTPPEEEPLIAGTPPGAPGLFEHIGSFLAVNGLAPTPSNYELAYQVVRADGDGLAGMLECPQAEPAPEAPAEPIGEQLAQLLEDALAAIAKVDGIVRESGADVRAYGDALQTSARDLDGASPARAMRSLVELTSMMVDRTRRAESRLAEMSREVDTLHGTLAEVSALAARDSLTGLPNRAAIEERLAEAVAAAERLSKPLALAYCDVDHFKRINDEFGHAVGDRVLKLVAEALRDGEAAGGFVGRYGGEEFLMMFEGLTASEAATHIDDIRERLSERHLRLRDTDRPIGQVTFSAGVAQLRAGEIVAELVSRADDRLLAAKREGRNRVEIDPRD
ncbi:GGDEF domain-containing protein [Sphingomonas naphthae]|uniref:diguanylate cyclase n=1 Tax=Sphingomonas naphthae TaxID=1813468 RepID=A0ABY7TFD5_9SPHN|nr:GGDEF domain-containing protein [Sphingomonas naphthae]WCT71947.1 GGDEF domain-containing protein [Sphingomonas naphthae]